MPTYSYDLATDVGKTRLNISDVDIADTTKAIFSDEELTVFLEQEGSVLLASAHALEVIAANEVLVQKRIKNLDLSTDGPAEAKELRELAKSWRDRYTAAQLDADEDSGFEIAEVVVDDFTLRQRLRNDYLRTGGQ